VDAVSTLSIPNMPHISRRRDSEGRVGREIEDIFSIISVIDEAKMIESIPVFVSDGPQNMPSINLVEGDLAVIMLRFDKLEMDLANLQSTVNKSAAMHATSFKQPGFKGPSIAVTTAATAASAACHMTGNQDVNRPDFMNGQATMSTTAIQPSLQRRTRLNHLRDKWLVGSSEQGQGHIGDWAGVDGYSSTGSISCDDGAGANWKTVSAKKKRRLSTAPEGRVPSQEPHQSNLETAASEWPPLQQHEQLVGVQPNNRSVTVAVTSGMGPARPPRPTLIGSGDGGGGGGGQNYAAAAAKPINANRRPRAIKSTAPMIVGTKKSNPAAATHPGYITAAKPYIGKSVHCIDNVSINVSAEDMAHYVSKLSVTVLSCSEVAPRRTRWQQQNDIEPTGRKAFRLCVPREERDKLLDADRWPAHIAISDWIFSKKKTATRPVDGRPVDAATQRTCPDQQQPDGYLSNPAAADDVISTKSNANTLFPLITDIADATVVNASVGSDEDHNMPTEDCYHGDADI